MVQRGLTLAVPGIAAGLVAALVLTRFIGSLLYEVGTHDVATFVAAPVVFLGIALLASYLPAHRAMRADPITAMR